MTEFASSNFISGNHGEYDVSKGHFVCLDPYAPAESPQAEFYNFQKNFEKPFDQGFPFVMGGLRAIIYHINLYDVQSGIYNAITVLFERSRARLISGTKVEIKPYLIPSKSQEKSFDALLAFRIIGIVWMVILTIKTLVSAPYLSN